MVMRRQVTLADVAARVGVSVGTVSKALNGRGQISSSTRERVLEAARELGLAAQPGVLPRSERSYLIGVISTDSYGRFTLPILAGAEDAFGSNEVSMLLAETRGDPIREQHYLATFARQRVDGIIVAGRSSDPRQPVDGLHEVPAVYALAPSLDPADISVVPDDRAGATRAVEHLIGSGRRSIAVIAGARRHAASTSRVDSALHAMADAGATLVGGEPLYGEWSERWGYEAATRLLHRGVDGVFCASDQIARGVVDCLRDNDILVPAQVAVTGVDNWDVIVDAARPSITSVDLNLREVGKQAAVELMRLVRGEETSGGIRLVDCFLVARQST